ncbi:MAG TPA: hypothetical protein VHV29_08340, partial [Terriglobales bacterium]|nr:hypothetical protein [Terriglobales bacterium]
RREFLDLERQIAKIWRRSVSGVDHSQVYVDFKKFYERIRKPSDLSGVKQIADSLIDVVDQDASFRFGMSLLSVPPEAQNQILERWFRAGKPAIKEFVPYFRHVLSVDLFFYLATAADLISRVRPTGKAGNMVDVAYLYYLPFCRIFTSSDNLHERVVPLFLREDQIFVKGPELKAELRKLDDHYSALPGDIKAKGTYAFASNPPEDTSFLITRLWDKYHPAWRQHAKREKLPLHLQKAILDLVKKIAKESRPQTEPSTALKSIQEVQYIHVERPIMSKKGKWTRVPPDLQ